MQNVIEFEHGEQRTYGDTRAVLATSEAFLFPEDAISLMTSSSSSSRDRFRFSFPDFGLGGGITSGSALATTIFLLGVGGVASGCGFETDGGIVGLRIWTASWTIGYLLTPPDGPVDGDMMAGPIDSGTPDVSTDIELDGAIGGRLDEPPSDGDRTDEPVGSDLV